MQKLIKKDKKRIWTKMKDLRIKKMQLVGTR